MQGFHTRAKLQALLVSWDTVVNRPEGIVAAVYDLLVAFECRNAFTYECGHVLKYLGTSRQHALITAAQTIPSPDITVIQDGRGQSGEEDIQ